MSGGLRALWIVFGVVLGLVAMARDAGAVGAPAVAPWARLGPGNFGGRTRALVAVSRTRLFAGAAPGGVWRSTNAGMSWSPLPGVPSSQRVSTIATDPFDPLTLYAGTGDAFQTGGAVAGTGVYQTRDGGDSWALLPSTGSTVTASFAIVNKVAVSRNDPTRLYAATSTGLFQSLDRGVTWTSIRSGGHVDVIVRNVGSTDLVVTFDVMGKLAVSINQGQSFALASGLPAGMARASLTFDANDLVVALLGASASGGVYRSTTTLATAFARIDRTGASHQAKANALILNAARNVLDFSNPSGPDCPFADPTSPDSGLYAQALAVSPVSVARVWVGGVDLWRSDNSAVDFGPASYSSLSAGQPAFARADQHAILFPPGYDGAANQTVYFAGDGGVFKTATTLVRVNQLPVVNAGPDRRVVPGSLVTLAGAAADADGQALAYTWSQTSGTPVTFATATANTTFTAPVARGAVLDFRLDRSTASRPRPPRCRSP